ncbi:MAG: phosphate signaling complex protein PhoU [Oscillospiraceae bacterium]|nr:phosphate signaling complex protein PhoU [Oscillospiraceae bacterium]
MRSRFDEQLNQLNENLIEMGAMVEDAITKSVKALKERDVEASRKIERDDHLINEKEKEIESLCLKLLLNQQPVARDLRTISTALKMITDIERIGDHAADIAEICVHLPVESHVTDIEPIAAMAKATMRMVRASIEAYVKKDLALAQSVTEMDDEVDELFIAVRQDMIALVHKDPNDGSEAFDIMQIAKYFERIGDHAVNIGEWVVFSITGIHKNTRIL